MAWARRGEAHHGVEERRTTTREWRDEEGQCLPEELAEGHLPDEEEGGVSTRMHMGEADLVLPLVAIRASCPCLMMDGGDSLVPAPWACAAGYQLSSLEAAAPMVARPHFGRYGGEHRQNVRACALGAR